MVVVKFFKGPEKVEDAFAFGDAADEEVGKRLSRNCWWIRDLVEAIVFDAVGEVVEVFISLKAIVFEGSLVLAEEKVGVLANLVDGKYF